MAEFHPKASMQTTEFKDLDGSVRDAVKLKYLDKALTKEQLKEMIVTPPVRK
jgi:hypothetical protein